MYDNLKEEINQLIINAKRNATRYMPNRYPELCEWLISTYSAPLAESAYLWLTETTKPTCPECGNHPRFVSFTKGHLTFCSSKCSNSSNETKKKAVATTFERFGVDNASKSDEIKLTAELDIGLGWDKMLTLPNNASEEQIQELLNKL